MKRNIETRAAVSAALVGGTIGTMGGIPGAILGATVGVLSGAFAALAIERQRRARALANVDDATWAAMIEAPREDDASWHTRQHPRAHVHYEYPPTFGNGSMLLRPSF
jgi:hypothetical protein